MSREHINTVSALYDALNRRDPGPFLAAAADDLQIIQSTEVPWGGAYNGKDGAVAFFLKLTSYITSNVTFERMIDAGERVVAIGRTRGTVNATGAPFDVSIAHVWTFRDGKVAQILFCIDNPVMLAALAA